MKQLYWSLLAVLCFISCSNQDEAKPVLNQAQFAALLADLSLQEAYIAQLPSMDSTSIANLAQRSTNLLVKHGISRAQLVTNFTYYQAHKEEFVVVYDSAIARLKLVQDSLMKAGK